MKHVTILENKNVTSSTQKNSGIKKTVSLSFICS